MPIQIARIGDQFVGICTNHSPGPPVAITGIIQNTPQDFVNDVGELVAVDGSSGQASCGHTGFVQASSVLTFINGIKIALLGDHVIGNGINANIISGSILTNSD